MKRLILLCALLCLCFAQIGFSESIFDGYIEVITPEPTKEPEYNVYTPEQLLAVLENAYGSAAVSTENGMTSYSFSNIGISDIIDLLPFIESSGTPIIKYDFTSQTLAILTYSNATVPLPSKPTSTQPPIEINYDCTSCQDTGQCSKCNNTGECSKCQGNGKVECTGSHCFFGTCDYCDGGYYEYMDRILECPYCDGSGYCKFCIDGYKDCNYCDYGKCSHCDGKGTCRYCNKK